MPYQNQVLNEIRDATIGQHDQSRHRAGNALRVAVGAFAGVAFGRVLLLVRLLGAAAARDQLFGTVEMARKRDYSWRINGLSLGQEI